MVCLACRQFSALAVCDGCWRTLVEGPDRALGAGLLVRSAWRHDGAARKLVHRLKYDGVVAAATVLAEPMAPLVAGPDPAVLVPVPRATLRRVRYGVDPALELARAVARRTGSVVVEALRPALTAPVHAGRARADRPPPRLVGWSRVGGRVVLVDDVVTTGVTLQAAAALIGCSQAVTATTVAEFGSS